MLRHDCARTGTTAGALPCFAGVFRSLACSGLASLSSPRLLSTQHVLPTGTTVLCLSCLVLSGPPNEVGILLLKMAWALHDDKEPERAARGR